MKHILLLFSLLVFMMSLGKAENTSDLEILLVPYGSCKILNCNTDNKTIDYHGISQEGNWKIFTKKDGLISDNLTYSGFFSDNRDNLWFLTDQGVQVYNDTSWAIYNETNGLIQRMIACHHVDRQGNVWLGTYEIGAYDKFLSSRAGDGGISVFNGREWKQYSKKNGDIAGPWVRQILEDSRNRIWITTSSLGTSASRLPSIYGNSIGPGGISMFENGEWTKFNEADKEIPGKFVDKIFEDSKGKIWFFSDYAILIYDENRFIIPSKKDGYKAGYIFTVFEDSKKNIWIGSADRVVKFDGNRWESYSKREGISFLHFRVFRVHESNIGQIIVTGIQGVCAFDGTKWKSFRFEHGGTFSGQDYGTYHSQFDADGNLWVYYNGNFGCYDGNEWKQESKKLDAKFYIDTKNRIWVPTENGLEIFSNGNWQVKENFKNIYGFIEDKMGNIWAGMNNGVLCFNGKNFEVFDSSNKLPSSKTSFLMMDNKGRVWIGSDKGLCCFTYNE